MESDSIRINSTQTLYGYSNASSNVSLSHSNGDNTPVSYDDVNKNADRRNIFHLFRKEGGLTSAPFRQHHLEKNQDKHLEFDALAHNVKQASIERAQSGSHEASVKLKKALEDLMECFMHGVESKQVMRSGQKQALAVWSKHFDELHIEDQTGILVKFVNDYLPKLIFNTTTERDAQRRGIQFLEKSLLTMRDQYKGRTTVAANLFLQIAELNKDTHQGATNRAIGKPLVYLGKGISCTVVGFLAGIGPGLWAVGEAIEKKESKNRNEGASLVSRELKHIRSVWPQFKEDPETKNLVKANFKAMNDSLKSAYGKKLRTIQTQGDAGKYIVPDKFDDYWKKKEGTNMEKFRMMFRT